MNQNAKKVDSVKPDRDLCRMITPPFRVSYPHIFKPQCPPGGKPKYSITMLFPKDQDLTGSSAGGAPRTLKEVIKNAKLAEFGPKSNWPTDLETAVIDGDKPNRKGEIKDGYKGHWVIKASSNEDQKPGVVDRNGVPITDPAEIYPGCYARAYVLAYVWKYMGKQGVGFILDHVQKVKDGKSFGGKKPVEQVFGPIGDMPGIETDDDNDDDGEDVDF